MAGFHARDHGFDSWGSRLFAFMKYVQTQVNLYIWCMYLIHTLPEHVLRQHVHRTTLQIHLFLYIPSVYRDYWVEIWIYMYVQCLSSIYTWYIIVCTWYIPCLNIVYHWLVSWKHLKCNFHCKLACNHWKLACNSFMIAKYSAYRQESAILYIHDLSLSVVAKNG